jgi:hypothetical protein
METSCVNQLHGLQHNEAFVRSRGASLMYALMIYRYKRLALMNYSVLLSVFPAQVCVQAYTRWVHEARVQ